MNIITQLESLVAKITKERLTEVWLSFSGHGTYVVDAAQEELDGRDEAIYTLDNDIITDDVINKYLSRIPRSCRVICLFDCCHSGTMADLRYKFRSIQLPDRRRRRRRRRRVPIKRRGRTRYVYRWITTWVTIPGRWTWKTEYNRKSTRLSNNILTISGCRDVGTSADVLNTQLMTWGGALTTAFIETVTNNTGTLTCQTLCHQLNKQMKTQSLSQQPVVCASQRLSGRSVFCTTSTSRWSRWGRVRPWIS